MTAFLAALLFIAPFLKTPSDFMALSGERYRLIALDGQQKINCFASLIHHPAKAPYRMLVFAKKIPNKDKSWLTLIRATDKIFKSFSSVRVGMN